jgi:hypothetical protein
LGNPDFKWQNLVLPSHFLRLITIDFASCLQNKKAGLTKDKSLENSAIFSSEDLPLPAPFQGKFGYSGTVNSPSRILLNINDFLIKFLNFERL